MTRFVYLYFTLAALATAALAPSSAATAGEVIYQTGFEAPDFILDILDGQNGWDHSRVTNPADAIVTDKYPADGSQGVKILGDQVFQIPNMNFWASGHFVNGIDFDPVDAGLPVVTFQADVALTGPATVADIYSANLDVGDGNHRGIASIWLSSDGTIHIADDNDDIEYVVGAFDFGTYYTLAMTLDYVNQLTDFYVNGDYVGTIPFATGSGNGFFSGYLELAALARPVDYNAYFDNYLVTATAP
jgi:hypothetical protein